MTDPLSITVSVIALLAATRKVAVGLEKLASVRGAPAVILQLNNELSDLSLVLSQAEPLLKKHAANLAKTLPPNTKTHLTSSIAVAQENVAELEVILSNRLKNRMGVRDKIGWLREQEKVGEAFNNLRNARQSIATTLAVVSSSTAFRIEADLQNLQACGEQNQAMLSTALLSQRETEEKLTNWLVEARQDHDEVLHGFRQSLATQEASSEKARFGNPPPYRETGKRMSKRPVHQVDPFTVMRMQFLRQRKCDVLCKCRCHTYARASTPDSLQSVVGKLFIGYSGLPALTPACTNDTCLRTSEGFLQVNYYFPRWFLARIVHVGVGFNRRSTIPKMTLRVLHVRDTFEDIFISARFNDVESVEYQLTTGRASVFDVTEDSGHSPLHFAMGKNHVEVVKVLLEMGAEPYLENKTQESPYDMAWGSIFSFQETPNASAWRVDEIRALFPGQEGAEEKRKFSKIHKIVLKILHIDLEKALRHDRSLIDSKDADGRTPLSWAAARGDSEAAEVLLRLGANPDTPDRIGQGPLRQAMKAHDASCAKLLLAYGATVDQTDNWDQTCLLSAMYYPNPLLFVEPLLAHGANVNTPESLGQSPLTEAVRENHADAARILLKNGAEPNHANHAGCTALHIGVRYNSHESLAVLFNNADVDHGVRDKRKRSVMHWAAECADLETLGLLRQERLHGLDPRDEDDCRLTAIDIANKRSDEEAARGSGFNTVNSEWLTAFSGLLESLLSFNTPKSVLSYTGSVVSEDSFFYESHEEMPLVEEKLIDFEEHHENDSLFEKEHISTEDFAEMV